MRIVAAFALFAAAFMGMGSHGFPAHAESARALSREFPKLDTGKRSIELREIKAGGPPRDGIPAISTPSFRPVGDETTIAVTEPVISVSTQCGATAYPLRVLMWHEIVNDTLCGVPVAITYCPLCNSAAVYERSVDGHVLDFGTTGRLVASNLVMYDRQTETFWQQFTGDAIVGTLNGKRLRRHPARIESFAAFAGRHPNGRIMRPPMRDFYDYGTNPYVGYDRSRRPMHYGGKSPPGVDPLARVVRVGDRAWTLELVRRLQRIETEDGLIIVWTAGQNSALDRASIARGRDIGNVVVTRRGADVPYSVDFAFAFYAFYPDSRIQK